MMTLLARTFNWHVTLPQSMYQRERIGVVEAAVLWPPTNRVLTVVLTVSRAVDCWARNPGNDTARLVGIAKLNLVYKLAITRI